MISRCITTTITTLVHRHRRLFIKLSKVIDIVIIVVVVVVVAVP